MKFQYEAVVTKGFPMADNELNALGADGLRLVGIVQTKDIVQSSHKGGTPYYTETFWYYFLKEEEI